MFAAVGELDCVARFLSGAELSAIEPPAVSLLPPETTRTLFTMRDELQVFSSFRNAEEADSAFYASLSPQERLDLLLDLVARHRESIGETAERFERVYRVIDLSQTGRSELDS